MAMEAEIGLCTRSRTAVLMARFIARLGLIYSPNAARLVDVRQVMRRLPLVMIWLPSTLFMQLGQSGKVATGTKRLSSPVATGARLKWL